MNDTSRSKPRLNPTLKLALDLGPLLVFFFANSRWGIYAATGAFMAAVAVAMAVSYALTRHIPMMAIVSAVVVGVFGGLTLFLQDETFIKLKPTIIYLLFGVILMAGLIFRKPLLAMVFDSVFDLDEEGWRKLTLRWALFFFALAIVNEIVWRTQTTDFWVSFKVFAILPLTLAFGAAQYPLLMRHANKTAKGE
jgi:intracellular septation protein